MLQRLVAAEAPPVHAEQRCHTTRISELRAEFIHVGHRVRYTTRGGYFEKVLLSSECAEKKCTRVRELKGLRVFEYFFNNNTDAEPPLHWMLR